MSSNRNNSQKKMSSIARRLNRKLFWRKFGIYFVSDVLLLALCVMVFAAATETALTGGVAFTGITRELIVHTALEDGIREAVNIRFWEVFPYIAKNWETLDGLVTYVVRDGAGVILETPVFCEMTVGGAGACGLLTVQTMFCLLKLPFEGHKIRKVLRPINDIAVKADELSRLQYDEGKYMLATGQEPGRFDGNGADTEKYHLLEEEITRLSPEESLKISNSDKELAGIETAINNLLVRQRESYMQQARFVNDASHELRTPIAVIEGYANMLARWGREDEKVLDESITAIQNESSHMKYLVEQLLFLARGDSGKTVLHFEDVNITEMMREIYEESLMIDENHVYRFSCPEEPVTGLCDPALLKQAVRILVDNAAKYTQEKDEITISVGETEDDHPYLQVQDSGIGMEESDVAHMFERFYRSDEVRSYKGTGLGLSIAKWIVDRHKGHFETVSRPGLGTRIRIVL